MSIMPARAKACALLGAMLTLAGHLPVATAAPEFVVNNATAAARNNPAGAPLLNGGFIVVWSSDQPDGLQINVYARRFRATGSPAGDEFRVNTTDGAHGPAVATLNDGTFVAVWQDLEAGIRAQRFAANGTPLGDEIRVNTAATAAVHPKVAIAALANGGFGIVWTTGTDNQEIVGQRFAANGDKDGPRFRANKTTAGFQFEGSIGSLPGGGFVVGWTGDDTDGTTEIFGQRFAATGDKVGKEFRVSRKTKPGDHKTEPTVIGVDGDAFIFAYTANDDRFVLANVGVFGQRFSADGAKLGPPFRINRETFSTQQLASLAVRANGDLVAVWSSAGSQDGDSFGVFGHRFSPEGARLGREFLVNQTTAGDQALGKVVVLTGDAFVVVWSGPDGSGTGIFGRRFGQ